jgi:hypothetical protein
MKPIVPDLSQNQTEISQGSSGVVEIPGHKSVPDKPGKSTKKKIPFLAGAVILIALGVIGLEVRSSRTQAVHHALQPAAELTVSVIHPRKAPITIPVLPAQTQAYTDAPIYAQTSGYLKIWYVDIGPRSRRVMFWPRLTLPKSIRNWTKRKLNLTRHGQGFTWPRSPGGAARNCSKGR